jgi:hypothetical protein
MVLTKSILEKTQMIESMLKNHLGSSLISFRVNEQGRSARGTIKCSRCGEIATFTACIDVGGIWIYCKCGTQEA